MLYSHSNHNSEICTLYMKLAYLLTLYGLFLPENKVLYSHSNHNSEICTLYMKLAYLLTLYGLFLPKNKVLYSHSNHKSEICTLYMKLAYLLLLYMLIYFYLKIKGSTVTPTIIQTLPRHSTPTVFYTG